MPRGDYQVENAEAGKPAPQDNSYKMCLVTIGIFFVICIILLLCTLPLKGGQTMNGDEYRADHHEGTREIPEEGYQPITTKRTTAAKYQEVTKPIKQVPTTVTPHVKTKSTKSTPVTSTERTTTPKYQEGIHEILEGDYQPVTSTERTTTPKYQEGTKARDQPPLSVTPYEETENTEDDETNTTSTVTPQQKPEKAVDKDIAENSNTSSTLSVLQDRTTNENDSTTHPYLHKEETDFTVEDEEWKYFSTPTVNDDQYNVTLSDDEENKQTNITESIIPEAEDKEQKYLSTPTVNDDQYNVTLSDDEENKQTNITENITPEVEEEHVPLHENEEEYNETTPIEEKGSQTEEERIHEGSSTKSYQLANETKEDGVTVSTVTEYEKSTSDEQSLFVKDIYAYEGNATSTTDGYAKVDEEEHTQATFSVDEVEDNSTTSAEEMYNQTTQERNSEDKKVIIVQITTPIDDQITYKDSEPSTESTVVLHQNQTDNENVSLTEESHMEEEMGVTNAYTKEDEAEHQLVTPAPNNNSTEDDTTDQESSTQTASEVQSDAEKQNNSDTEDDTHVTNLTTEDKMTEAITEVALKTTTKQSLQTTVSADTPVCVLPNVTSNATRGNVCFSSKCKSQAKHLMKTMSFNADACDDFYEFACGDVRTNKYLQPENLEQNTWDRIRSSMKKDSSIAGDKFKSFYNQCLYYDSITKEERINQAIEILQTVGTFYNSTSWKTNSSNFTQLFLNMLQLHSAPLFDVLLDVENTKGERFDFQIIPPLSHSLFQDVAETEIHCREDILHDYRNKNTFLLNHAYEEYMNCTLYPEDLLHKITEALEKFSAFESYDEEDTAFVRLRQAIEFSILPCKRSLPNKREMLQKLLTKDFHSTTVKELNSLYPMIEWDILLEGLLGKEVPENLVVQLYFKDYFDELFHNMKTVEMYELHNAVLALFAQELYFNLVETKGACHRPSYCLKVASTLMQDVSSFLYLSSFTHDELQNFDRELQEISKKIKTTFKHMVEEEDTLLTAKDKIEEMEIITNGGMDIFGVKGFVDTLLNDTEIDDANGYLINAVKLTRRYRKNMYQLFFKNPRNNKSIWTHFVHPYSFQPVAIYPLNMVVIPYGYLGALQSYDSLMGYMRNVRLAIPLAQHMMHHFDTIGKMFNTSHLNYETFEYCLDLSYSSRRSWKHAETKQIMDFKVDAPLFHNQRLTDFLALRTVLEAYKTEINSEKVLPWLDLNQEQIYFLVFAQTLCTKSDLLEDVISLFEDEYLPPTLRVPDIMSNSEEFGAAYHCGVGMDMNPEIKCKLFSTEELASYVYDEDVPKEQTANSQEVH